MSDEKPSIEEQILETLEAINLDIKKQDGVNVDVAKHLSAISDTLKDLAKKNTGETQSQLLKLVAQIEKHQKPSSMFKRATWATAKAPFQFIGSVAKTVGMTVGIPSLIALGVHVGNGNDPMNIPCDITGWSNKHFGSQASLTLTFESFCASTHNLSRDVNHQHWTPDSFDTSPFPEYDGQETPPETFPYLPPGSFPEFEEQTPKQGKPYDPFAPKTHEFDA